MGNFSVTQDSRPMARCPIRERVSAPCRLRLGYCQQQQIGIAGKLGHLLRAAEYVVASRLDHDQRRAAANEFRQHRRHPSVWRASTSLAGTRAGSAELPPGTFPLFTGVRVFSRDYANPRIYTTNVAFEQELAPGLAAYVDFTHSKGVHLTRFVNINLGPAPFGPALGDVFVTSSSAKSLYRGFDCRRAQAIQPRVPA